MSNPKEKQRCCTNCKGWAENYKPVRNTCLQCPCHEVKEQTFPSIPSAWEETECEHCHKKHIESFACKPYVDSVVTPKTEDWEEELKRQCEARQLVYEEIKYLVDEILASERKKLCEEIEKIELPKETEQRDRVVYQQALDDIIKIIKQENHE